MLDRLGKVMASQPTPRVNLTVAEFNSFIRGYHAYKDIWIPVQGEVLILKCEPNNVGQVCCGYL